MWRSLIPAVILSLTGISSVSAQGSFYVGASGGAVLFLDQNIEVDFLGVDDGANVDFEYDPGFHFAGKLGYRVDTNIRIEGEVSYAQADAERQFEFNLLELDVDTDQELSILSFTGGIFLDLWPVGTFVPYVGGGIGYANVEVDNENLEAVDQNVFTTFAEIGLPFAITPSVSVVPAARFNWYLTEEDQADGATVIGDDLLSTQFQLGLNYFF